MLGLEQMKNIYNIARTIKIKIRNLSHVMRIEYDDGRIKKP